MIVYTLNDEYTYDGETDYVSALSRDHIAHYIWSHDFLTGRYLSDDGKVRTASHRMFDLKPDFIKIDVMKDSIKKMESQTMTENSLESELAKSSFSNASVQASIKSYAWAGASTEASGGVSYQNTRNTNETGSVNKRTIIRTKNFQRARINTTKNLSNIHKNLKMILIYQCKNQNYIKMI